MWTRYAALAAFLTFSTSSASAFEAADVMRCFNAGLGDEKLEAEADLKVELDTLGIVKSIEVLRYKPDSEDGRRLALTSTRAVQACGPYDPGQTTVYVTLGPNIPSRPAVVITIPKRADGLDDSLGNEIKEIIGK